LHYQIFLVAEEIQRQGGEGCRPKGQVQIWRHGGRGRSVRVCRGQAREDEEKETAKGED